MIIKRMHLPRKNYRARQYPRYKGSLDMVLETDDMVKACWFEGAVWLLQMQHIFDEPAVSIHITHNDAGTYTYGIRASEGAIYQIQDFIREINSK